eukprot:gene4982-21327_t
MCILDLSKTLMYDLNYNYIKKKYGAKAKMFFTATDSLTYEIEAEDVYQDYFNDKNKFDNSDYPESSPFFDQTNKKRTKFERDGQEYCIIPSHWACADLAAPYARPSGGRPLFQSEIARQREWVRAIPEPLFLLLG